MTMKFPARPSCAWLISSLGVAAVIGGCSNDASQTDNFAFNKAAPDRYVRVDRTGEPAIATALLSRDPAISPPSIISPAIRTISGAPRILRPRFPE